MKFRYVFLAVLPLLFLSAECKTPGEDPGTSEPEQAKGKKDYPAPAINPNPLVDYTKWEIKNGKFYLDGKWVFLKSAKPLVNFADASAVKGVIAALDTLRNKHYNVVLIDLYWKFFDTDGDGVIDKSLTPLNNLIDEIYQRGMYPGLDFQTYSVGGNMVPEGFWTAHPDAWAIDSNGDQMKDTEYGTNAKVVSIFYKPFRETARNFIRGILNGVDTKKILWYETTVEPQYMGVFNLCYSESAREEYAAWRTANHINDVESVMPETFPIPTSFINNATWNKFRAQFLARWINEDAAVIRSIAGEKAYVAVDYLDATEGTMQNRLGDPIEFLTSLTCANIIQVNWTWHLTENHANQKAYDRVWQVKNETGRDWAISEHMTFNGSDFTRFDATTLDNILENTLKQGTRLGWDFTNTYNKSYDDFALYYNDWTPKKTMKAVDAYWGWWLHRVEEIEKEKNP